jgi:tetratricopeptide (TPR) repeat protein
MHFGERLRQERQRRQLSQEALAGAIGFSPRSLRRWEQGQAIPRGYSRLQLSRFFGLSPEELFEDAGDEALPSLWSVPHWRNPFFTGREEILEMLHTRLNAAQALAFTRSYALQGLGGIGKTQIALEYAYRYAQAYSAVFWIEAETLENVLSSTLRIAKLLQLPEREEKDHLRIVATVQRWLSTHNNWLMIWDNLEDLDLFRRWLQQGGRGTILITTRRQALGALAQGLDLAPMEREEALLLVLRRARVLEPEATSEHVRQLAASIPGEYAAALALVEAMGGLPLALDQAGAHIEETGCSVADYLRRYEQQRARLLDRRGVSGESHPASVAATFRLSSTWVEQEQRAAADLLRVCALLHAEAIPEELFGATAAYLGPELAPLAADPAQFDQALATLRHLSLVQRQVETRTLSIHRLVQAVQRECMSEQEQAQWLQRVVTALNTLFPEVIQEAWEQQEAWKQCERLLPHVLACAVAIPDQAGDQVLAEVLRKVADYLRDRAQYEQAVTLYQRALRILEPVVKADHPDLAYPLDGLALLYFDQGKYEQAEPLFLRALHIREHALGPEHLLVAYPLHNLGLISQARAQYEQAEPLFLRALHIREHALGPEHLQVAYSLNCLGLVYKGQGKYKQVEAVCQRALHIWEQTLGPTHPDLIRVLNNLANLYKDGQGRYAEAKALFQRALSIWEQAALELEHPFIGHPFNNLADLYLEQGEYEQAKPLYLRALYIWEQAWGVEHPDLAYPLYGLARLCFEQGEYEEAEALYQRALRLREQALGMEHPDVAVILNGQANLCREQGKDEQAERLYQRALHLQETYLGPHHADLAQTLHDLAVFRQKQGSFSEAYLLAERALQIREQSLGDTHPATVATSMLCAQLAQPVNRRIQ